MQDPGAMHIARGGRDSVLSMLDKLIERGFLKSNSTGRLDPHREVWWDEGCHAPPVRAHEEIMKASTADTPVRAERAKAAEVAQPVDEGFDFALSLGGRLMVEDDGKVITLTREKTRRLLAYLDRLRADEGEGVAA